MKRAAFLPLALISAQAAALPPQLESGVWHCTYTEELRCDPGRACQPIELNATTLLDPRTSRYMRCWNGLSDCDSSAAQFSTWGEYLTAQIPGDGTFVKVSTNLTVTEVSTIGELVFIHRGRCMEGPPPVGRVQPLPPR